MTDPTFLIHNKHLLMPVATDQLERTTATVRRDKTVDDAVEDASSPAVDSGATSRIPTGTPRRQFSHARAISQATINRLSTPRRVTPRHRSVSPAKSSPLTKLFKSPRLIPHSSNSGSDTSDTASVASEDVDMGIDVKVWVNVEVGGAVEATLKKFEELQVGPYAMTLAQLKNLMFEKCMSEGCFVMPELLEEDGWSF